MGTAQRKTVVITGGAEGIGRCIAQMFRKEGAEVYVIDKAEGEHYVGDIGRKEVLEDFAAFVLERSEGIDYLINNAPPPMRGIDACSYEEFQAALSVGLTAAFYLTKLFQAHFRKGAAIVNISSTRERMSQAQSESYAAAKGGIGAMTHALAISLAGRVRVNAVSPGWIETRGLAHRGADCLQHPVGRVGRGEDIAAMVLYLCSERAGFINGENICIDGGMSRQMIYHQDFGWYLQENDKDRIEVRE